MYLQSQSKIGNTWNSLPIEERVKFVTNDVIQVTATNPTLEQPHHTAVDIPNPIDLPLTDEEIPATTNHVDHEDQTIKTRCTPSRWCRVVNKLSDEQKDVVRAMGFGNLNYKMSPMKKLNS